MNEQGEQKVLPGIKRPEPIKKRKPRSRLDNRMTIVVLFVITVLGSLFFYFKTEAPRTWQRLFEPRVISSLPGGVDYRSVVDEVKKETANLQGSFGFYVYRFEDGLIYGLNDNQVFPAASLIKLPVILTLYQEAEVGEIDLETKYSLKEQDKRGGAGVIQSAPAGTVYTYQKLAELMGQQSDNTAFNVLRQILGEAKIQETINDLGMFSTSLKDNQTTPADIGLFWELLYEGGVVSDDYRDEILDYLTETAFEDRIPAGVPEEVRVAHKIGTDARTFSDAGIVFSERPFILVIMSQDALESEALEVLPKITRIVWGFEGR